MGFPDPRPITSLGVVFRDHFAGASLNTSKWLATVGAGGTITQSAGTLTLGSGTTANAATSVISNQMFQFPCKVAVGLSLSQRIANQTFFIELVSVDPTTGLPDGQDQAAIVFDGTTATQAKHQVTTGALAANTSAASTYPTTASAQLFEIEATTDDVWFHGTSGLDGSGHRTNSYRLQLKAPDPTKFYELRLRWLNGATPPASNTNALVTFLVASEYQELATEITGTRGTSSGGAGIAFAGSQPVRAMDANGATGTLASFSSAASTNATSTKTSAGNLYEITLTNNSAAAKFFKFYNKASAPTVGTDVPIWTIPIPANSAVAFELGIIGKRFSTGIAYAITNLQPVSDTTAVAAGDVIGSFTYA